MAQRLKCLPAVHETWVQSLGQEDPLEKEMATHSSILAWRIPWTEEPGGLQSTGSQSRTQLSDFTFTFRTWKQPRCSSTGEWIKKLWYIYMSEYYSAIKRNAFESVLMRWVNLEPIIQSEVSQKEKDEYYFLTHIYGI